MKNKNLWAPWRMAYLGGERSAGCVFCNALAASDDRESLLLYRGEHCFVMMNKFPYASGHLMILPNEHQGRVEELGPQVAAEAWTLTLAAKRGMEAEMSPDGFNVGLNIGCAGGAGIVDHLHWHVVPRWEGDTNFMPVLTGDRVISQQLEDTFDLLHPHFRVEIPVEGSL